MKISRIDHEDEGSFHVRVEVQGEFFTLFQDSLRDGLCLKGDHGLEIQPVASNFLVIRYSDSERSWKKEINA